MQQEMRYIYTVYQKGSFSKAAAALYLTQPALSIAVQKVEAEIGMPLFDRNHQPLRLTEAGEIYIQKVRQIQALEDDMRRQFNDLSGLNTGSMRIGGSHYFNSYVLPPVLAIYMDRHPGIRLELVEAGSFELVGLLREHAIDMTFSCSPLYEDDFDRSPAFQDTVLLAVPAAYPVNRELKDFALTGVDVLAKRHTRLSCPAIRLEAFGSTPFILLTSGNNLHARSEHFFETAGIKPQVKLEVAQLVTAYHLARAGLGATFISDILVTDPGEDTLYYKINSSQAIRHFDLVLPKGSYVSNALREFIRVFKGIYWRS